MDQIDKLLSVNPLPHDILKRLYAEPDDDKEQIAKIIAAQSQGIDE
jgi:hypothetical protein